MNVKYLGTLFAALVLSLGLITGCETPEAGETEVDTDTGVVEEDGAVLEEEPGIGEEEVEVETEE